MLPGLGTWHSDISKRSGLEALEISSSWVFPETSLYTGTIDEIIGQWFSLQVFLCPCACSVIQSSLTLGTFVLCLWNSPRQEYWNGLSFPPPEDLPNPGIKLMFPASPALQACSLPLRSSQALKVLTFYSRVFPLATRSFLRCVPGQFINITKVNFIALNTGSPKPFRSSAPETETITKYTYVVQSLSLFVIPQTAGARLPCP